MKAVGVHIFAGGFTVGVEQHFDVLAHLEAVSLGAKTWARNRPGIPRYRDAERSWASVLPGLKAAAPDFIFGNPPCRAFSRAVVAGKRGTAVADAKWAEDCVRVGAETGAKVVAVESVRGALRYASQVHDHIWAEYRSVYPGQMWVLVNAADHGIPQWRARLFWVLAPEIFGWRQPRQEMPTVLSCIQGAAWAGGPTPGLPNTEDPTPALDMNGRWGPTIRALIPEMAQGERMAWQRSSAKRETWRQRIAAEHPAFAEYLAGRAMMMYLPLRLREDRPTPVVYGNLARFVHPVEDRLLTVRELSRLCGFPDSWEWVGGIGNQMDQLGKGVCPPVGAWLAGEVAAYLRGERAERGPGSTLVADTDPRQYAFDFVEV